MGRPAAHGRAGGRFTKGQTVVTLGTQNTESMVRNLRAAAGAESRSLLDTLLVEHAGPLVRQTVLRRFRSARRTTMEDFEDVCSDAISAILLRLRRHREGGPEIQDFEGYTATVASNTADRFFAARAPQRARLRNCIRYVLTTEDCFELQEQEKGIWMCSVRKGAVPNRSGRKLPGVVFEILTAAKGSLELSELTTLAAAKSGISDQRESLDGQAALVRDTALPFAHTAEWKQWLEQLWLEVCELPVPQRVALLQNLGSGNGTHAGTTLCCIVDLGIASFEALAAVMGMSEGALAEIWNRVPLADNEIAAQLELSRQQVINLRAAARQRLARRMKDPNNKGMGR